MLVGLRLWVVMNCLRGFEGDTDIHKRIDHFLHVGQCHVTSKIK